ncbi:protein-ADP-ribose hydrolase [Chitinophaga sp.]|uniref:protein-ADP-ribose hydrolase n=1 Tax=Chitinophaga sp. TaxID=1869181 RepID=UPI0031E32041
MENSVLDKLLDHFGSHSQMALDLSPRERLKAILTTTPPPLAEKVLALTDELFSQETRPAVIVNELLWKGDITTLKADAIVNAANSQMLGCFHPFHKCIDNAIHSVAGPRLREACYQLMLQQGHAAPTGQVMITPGYFLPARYVLHTVGPIVGHRQPTPLQEQQLATCYTNCLEMAAAHGDIESIAFCCISTGVFGYPPELAAKVAVNTVQDWLITHPHSRVQKVIFNVFSDADYLVYQKELAVWKLGN